MNDRREIENVAQDLDLSDTAKEAISRYPLPEHLPAHNKYAALTYYQLDAQQPLCGTIHNHASKEMRFAPLRPERTSMTGAESSGAIQTY